MAGKTILILGGYGGTGLPMTRLLLRETSVRLILAGRNRETGEKIINQLNAEFPGNRTAWRYAEAADYNSLITALNGIDLLVVCSPSTQYTEQVGRAAISAGVDYFDIHYPQKVVAILRSLEPSIQAAGRCFITQAGFHPGLLAPFFGLAASYFTRYEKAFIGMAMNVPRIGSMDSATELIEGMADFTAQTFEDEAWRPASYIASKKIDFGSDFGIRACYPIWFEEMKVIPEEYGLKTAGAYVAGFNWFIDYLVIPLNIILFKLKKGLGSRFLTQLLLWGSSTFSKPPYGVWFQLEAEGEMNGQARFLKITAQHEDGYYFTAAPAVACLLQYLDDSIRKPGLQLAGNAVEPKRLIKDIERMGILLHIEVKDESPL